MKMLKMLLGLMVVLMYWNLTYAEDTILWHFEDGDDHGFTLRCQIPATPADDDPNVAGDESITGVYGPDGLPGAGVAWTIGPPDQFDYLEPAVLEGCHCENGWLEYGPCNDPFGAAVGDPPYDFMNGLGQLSYLNTYNLSQWGDDLHLETNDQIATSPVVLLGEGAVMTVWAVGNTTGSWAGTRIAPVFDEVEGEGYASGSGGIAILSAADGSMLDTLLIAAEGIGAEKIPDEFTLDLSALSGAEVIIEVVDAFQGGWGWLAIDMIEITNATLVETDVAGKPGATLTTFALEQNYPNPFNPVTNIQFQIPKDGHVTISVYNSLGEQVATLVDGNMKSGMHRITFDAAQFSSGIYFYSIITDGFSQTKKMMIVK
ncbi:T9SS type A sorting domain-containing protein [candidate division KSB1 bacterium]|nr:T9SS type A sorting domain-containing protein [candidate division KSB1 bacterium]